MEHYMSLDKAIKHGKEHRKPYHRAKAWSMSCRNHGSCGYCLGNKMHKHNKKLGGVPYKKGGYEDY